jgi:hypothetical protein
MKPAHVLVALFLALLFAALAPVGGPVPIR